METRPHTTTAEDVEKVEFPTFLEQQPTIILGCASRELLLLACGGSLSLSVWQLLQGAQTTMGGIVLSLLFCTLPLGLAALLAFVKVGTHFPEQWVFVFLGYACSPKLYVYSPLHAWGEEPSEDKPYGDDSSPAHDPYG
jgi:hypothetical protein